jgi:CPA1 family monovalent cation:H+ antiporter
VASIGQRVRRRFARPEAPGSPLCEHLQQAPADATPLSERCAGCDAQGTSWIDLRLCLACGEVGCCDSSPWQHAAKHAEAAGHPVMRSFMPGEDWRWCYVDELLG